MEKRLEKLQSHRRVPRSNTKKNSQFWTEGGKQASAANLKRKTLEHAASTPPVPSTATSTTATVSSHLSETALKAMTVAELSSVLSNLLGKRVGKRQKTVLVQQILQEQERRAEEVQIN